MSDVLYHATPEHNLLAIRTTGLKPDFLGDVYLANKSHYAAGFLSMRALTLATAGVEFVVVVAVPVANLDADRLTPSIDHNPMFYPDDLESWVHDGPIPPDAIDWGSTLKYPLKTVPS